jgi:hypothetical protein
MGDWSKKAAAWIWAGLGNFVWLAGLVSFTTVAALAARATGMMASWAPLSWVGAGGLGFLTFAIGTWFYGVGKAKIVRNRYDARLLAQGGAIDPLAKTFERKRIFLNEFVLPSVPYVEGKTFIDCEIVGPANIILRIGNNVTDHKLPICDGYVMQGDGLPHNGYVFDNCFFKGCSFNRVSLMFFLPEYARAAQNVNWLVWRSVMPTPEAIAAALNPSPEPVPQKLITGPTKRKWPWQK